MSGNSAFPIGGIRITRKRGYSLVTPELLVWSFKCDSEGFNRLNISFKSLVYGRTKFLIGFIKSDTVIRWLCTLRNDTLAHYTRYNTKWWKVYSQICRYKRNYHIQTVVHLHSRSIWSITPLLEAMFRSKHRNSRQISCQFLQAEFWESSRFAKSAI
jgi:hypothetical protein